MLELPLLDFCTGHRLILLRQRNPLLWQAESDFNSEPFERQCAALIEAVYTCAQSFAGRQRLEKDPTRLMLWKNARLVKRWHRARRRAELFHMEQSTEYRLAYWSTEVAKFRNYLASSRLATEFDERRDGFPFLPVNSVPEADGRALGGPYDAALIQFMIRELRLSMSEAMEYPIGLAQAHFLVWSERQGNIRILNQDEMQFREQNSLRDLEEAKAAGFATAKEYFEHCLTEAKAAKEKRGAEEAKAHG